MRNGHLILSDWAPLCTQSSELKWWIAMRLMNENMMRIYHVSKLFRHPFILLDCHTDDGTKVHACCRQKGTGNTYKLQKISIKILCSIAFVMDSLSVKSTKQILNWPFQCNLGMYFQFTTYYVTLDILFRQITTHARIKVLVAFVFGLPLNPNYCHPNWYTTYNCLLINLIIDW